ncbi:hypothetical protein LJB76_01480 [Clostridia bacterium OttesenSCG-928-O13]|nr:hypothetical protein [Clostridia bacterium OttesenSCG-928-O13]
MKRKFVVKRMSILRVLAITVAILLVFSACTTLTLNYLFIKSNYYRSVNNIFKFENVPNQIDVAIFGSSHAEYAFGYPNIPGKTVFNFSMASQIPYYDNQLAQEYRTHFSQNCVAVIVVSFFSLYFSLNMPGVRMPERYYRLLAPENVPHATLGESLKYKYFPLFSSNEGLKHCFEKRDKNLNYELPNYHMPEEKDFDRVAAERAFYHYASSGGVDKPIAAPENLSAYMNLIETFLALPQGKVVLLIPPYSRQYVDSFPVAFLESFYKEIDKILALYPDIAYFNYSRSEKYMDHWEWFVASDHLSDVAREQFVAEFFLGWQKHYC